SHIRVGCEVVIEGAGDDIRLVDGRLNVDRAAAACLVIAEDAVAHRQVAAGKNGAAAECAGGGVVAKYAVADAHRIEIVDGAAIAAGAEAFLDDDIVQLQPGAKVDDEQAPRIVAAQRNGAAAID